MTVLRELGAYLLWQVPSWVLLAALLAWLARAFDLAWSTALVAFGIFVAKDLIMFPAMRAAFRAPPPGRPVGERGEVIEPLDPIGYVRVSGEIWRAEARGQRIAAGRRVVVRGARGLTLIVEEATSSPRS